MENTLGPHGHDFSELAILLRSYERETLVFVPNPGNAGDALINLGMFELFSDLGVTWEMGSFNLTYPDRVVVFSGGGALIEEYANADAFFRRNINVCKALILLPHTVRGYGNLISAMDSRCHLFAREKISYQFLEMYAVGGARVYTGHDMAFYLSKKSIENANLDWRLLMSSKIGISWAKMVIKILFSRLQSSTLSVIRDDIEKTDVCPPVRNYDLSILFATGHLQSINGHMTPGVCASTAKVLKVIVQRYKKVETNRLHISILCAILDINVAMLDNSYGKNKSIFSHSIENYFSGVKFLDDFK